jgi:hypothetical protein
MQACTFCVPPVAGEDLEVELDGMLWPTHVLEVLPHNEYRVAGISGTDLVVSLEELRPSLRWDWQTGAWINKQAEAKAALADKEAGSVELAVLAYCSLATSVVQVVGAKPGKLGEGCVGQLLALASDLAKAANRSSSSSSGGKTPSGSSSTCSTSGAISNSSSGGRWGMAASLAAAVAAGAYNAHHQQLQAAVAALQAQEADNESEEPAAGGSMSSNNQSGNTASGSGSSAAAATSSKSTAAPTGCDATLSCRPEGASACPVGCSTCSSAAQLYMALCFLERGMVPPPSRQDFAKAGGVALLLEAAQQQGITFQQHLQQLLLALASRHPVPGVCRNVLCGRLEGPTAVGAVRGRVHTLCGGCRAAWYCCEACQSAAWPVHSKTCKGANSKVCKSTL